MQHRRRWCRHRGRGERRCPEGLDDHCGNRGRHRREDGNLGHQPGWHWGRLATSGLFLVKEWQGYLPYLSTRFPAFRRELHRSALQRGGCQHVIITKSFPPQLPTKKEVEYETQTERDRWHNCGKNVRGQHTNKDQIYRHTFEERTHSMSATKRKQPLEKKRMVSSISKR